MITILLSTYNGARFLPEQLASFEHQTYSDWRVIWRDDGSTDDTIAIMEEFSARTKRCTHLVEPTERLGPTSSFLLLLKSATYNLQPEDIVMFSDQDDVWLPEKLERARNALKSNSLSIPTLYFSSQRLVDSNLRDLGRSKKINFLPSFPDCLAQNVASGCTMALNFAAAKLISNSRAPSNTYHDWWSYIIVSAHGGQCIYDDTETIFYRQHENNVVGTQKKYAKRAALALARGPSRFIFLLRDHIVYLESNIELLDDKSRHFIFLTKKNVTNKFKFFFTILNTKVKRQNKIETLLFYIWILLG